MTSDIHYLPGHHCRAFQISGRELLVSLVLMIPLALFAGATRAESFTADVVQISGDDITHARIYWSGGRVRFDYLDQGVQMAQIFDQKNNRMVWLDIENKVYIERQVAGTKQKQNGKRTQSAGNQPYDPCTIFQQARCIRLKSAEINHRDTDKWLITFDIDGRDEHMFQWIDKQYRIPVRQENPDGSIFDVSIVDDIELDGRKVHKVEMLTISPTGQRSSGIQWYDSELNVVVRQQDDNGTVEELRNIKLEPVSEDKFVIPGDYEAFNTRLSDPENGSSIIFNTAQN